jgi:hypothetical protein
MKRISIKEHIQQVIKDNPEPPRDYHLSESIKIVYTQSQVILQLIVSLGLFLSFGYLVVARGLQVNDIIPIGLLLSFIFVSLAHPFMIRNIFITLKYGSIGEAEVIDSTSTFDGQLKWKVLIRTRHSVFEQILPSQPTWVDEIIKGTRFKVLVHPKKDKVLFIVGVIK